MAVIAGEVETAEEAEVVVVVWVILEENPMSRPRQKGNFHRVRTVKFQIRNLDIDMLSYGIKGSIYMFIVSFHTLTENHI